MIKENKNKFFKAAAVLCIAAAVAFGQDGKTGSYTIPNSVTYINYAAFASCYLIIVQAKGAKETYAYSAKVGVRK